MRHAATLILLGLTSVGQAQVPEPSKAPIPAGTYHLDKPHATLLFRVNHLGFSSFTGRFAQFDATLDFDPRKPAAARVEVSIDPRSISTDNAPEGFLDMLSTGKEWLDAGEFATMRFVSTRVEVVSPSELRVHGDLTLRGVTRPLVLATHFNGGYASHPFDPAARVGFSARGTLKRSEFGMTAGIPAPGSTFGVGDEVQVVLEAEFTGPPPATARR